MSEAGAAAVTALTLSALSGTVDTDVSAANPSPVCAALTCLRSGSAAAVAGKYPPPPCVEQRSTAVTLSTSIAAKHSSPGTPLCPMQPSQARDTPRTPPESVTRLGSAGVVTISPGSTSPLQAAIELSTSSACTLLVALPGSAAGAVSVRAALVARDWDARLGPGTGMDSLCCSPLPPLLTGTSLV